MKYSSLRTVKKHSILPVFRAIQGKRSDDFIALVKLLYARDLEKDTNFLAWINPKMVDEWDAQDEKESRALKSLFYKACLGIADRVDLELKFEDFVQTDIKDINLTTIKILNDYCNAILLTLPFKLPKHPFFTIIIPTFNGGEKIIPVLDALQAQKGVASEQGEVIIIDDGSTNNTRDVILSYLHSKHRFPVKYVRLKSNMGPSVARNIGILHARGELLCFTDDDCLVPQNWLTEFLRAFKANPEIAGVGGWYQTHQNGNESIFDQYLYWYALPAVSHTCKSSYWEGNACGNTANLCLRKSAVMLIGGFNPLFLYPGFDDWELKIRMHSKRFALLNHDRMVQHLKRHNLKSFIRLHILRGWGRFLIYRLHGIEPRMYNVSLWNGIRSIFYIWRRIINDRKNLHINQKIIFFAFAICVPLISWLGKYWMPLEISRRFSSDQ